MCSGLRIAGMWMVIEYRGPNLPYIFFYKKSVDRKTIFEVSMNFSALVYKARGGFTSKFILFVLLKSTG